MTLIIGHKGAPALAAENRVPSFVQAREVGADGVELDVRRVGDGSLAVWHDPELPDGRVLLDLAWGDVDDAVDELDPVLDACRGLALVNVEIKNWMYDRDFDETLAVADTLATRLAGRTADEQATYVVSCFHQPTVDRARKALDDLAPAVRVGWLLWNVDDPAATVGRARSAGYAAIHPHHSAIIPELVATAHDAGLTVNCWTCNDPDRIRWLAEVGTDGIITDDPVLARQALGKV